MYLVFLDESGSPCPDYPHWCEKQAKQRAGSPGTPMPACWFILASVGIEECHLPMVDEWFGGIEKGFLQNATVPPGQEYEIKGEVLYSLREGKPPASWIGTRKKKRHIAAQKAVWTPLSASQLANLEKSVFDLLVRLSPVVWAVVVNQREDFARHGPRTWPPYYHALTYLQQRVLHHVQASHGAYQRALFVLDETSTLTTAAQFDEYLSLRETINATAAWPVEFGRYLVDVPVFGKSHLHQALQLVDVIAHAMWRRMTKTDALGWFGRIEPLLAKHWKTGDYDNAGLTVIGQK